MSKKNTPNSNSSNVTVKWLNGNNEVVSSKDATWLLISPFAGAPEIKVGERDRDNCLPAMNFAQDTYRLGRYNHPMTDWGSDIHVYSDRNSDTVYKEAAGVVGPASPFKTNGSWWSCDLVKIAGKVVLQPSRKLDGVNHTAEIHASIVKRMKAAGKTADQIKAALAKAEQNEKDRAWADLAAISKHAWGQYYGYAFRIWIAHIRARAEVAYAIINEPDDEKAWDIRNKGIQGAVAKKQAKRDFGSVPNVPLESATDKPDFDSEDDDAPKAVVASIEPIIFPFVAAGGKLSGKNVNIAELPAGVLMSLWLISGSRLTDCNFDRMWNPANTALVDILRSRSITTEGGRARYGVEFSETYLPK